MMYSMPELVIILYAVLYLLIAVMLVVGIKRLKSYGLPAELPRVSVIVCARNEEKDIGRCLNSLILLDYPREKLEVIVVDDESEDRTAEILSEYASRNSMFKILSTENELQPLPGKQRPLNFGVGHAWGEIILVTDADIEVEPGWIKGHIAAYGENTGIVGGITRVSTESGSLFDTVQNADQISKLTIAMGCAGLGLPLTIMGNNCSFRREAYEACGGFGKMEANIVEDVALLYCMTRTTGYRLNWASSPESVTVSAPESDLSSFIEQRYRMTSILHCAPLFGKMLLGMECAMVFAVVVSIFLAIVSPAHSFFLPLITAGSWMVSNALVLAVSPGIGLRDILAVPGMLVFQLIYGKGLSRRILFGNNKVVWKDRRYNTR